MRAIQITEFGGPEVLTLTDLPEPEPRAGHVLVDVDSAGLNYADTHQSENSYLAPQRLPLVPGAEVVGRTDDGRRVVALLMSGGGYAERALPHESVTFDVPDGVDDTTALGLVLQGTTAWHLLRTTTSLRAGETVVVHAAGGGVGSLAVQLAKLYGAGRVIATASTPDKRELALDLGADDAVDVQAAADAGGADAVRELLVSANDGHRVDVVLEMTGGAVHDGSLAALAPLGRMAVYGMASRTPGAPVRTAELMATSRTVAGFWLVHAMRLPGGLDPAMAELLQLAASGALTVVDGGTYPLAEAARAHEDLRARRTTGKLRLDVRA